MSVYQRGRYDDVRGQVLLACDELLLVLPLGFGTGSAGPGAGVGSYAVTKFGNVFAIVRAVLANPSMVTESSLGASGALIVVITSSGYP